MEEISIKHCMKHNISVLPILYFHLNTTLWAIHYPHSDQASVEFHIVFSIAFLNASTPF